MHSTQFSFCLGDMPISVMADFIILSIWGWLDKFSQSIISSPQIIGWKQFRQMFSDSRNKHIFQGGGGRGVRPSFLKKFPSFFLVIYLDRRSEGGGQQFLNIWWYISHYICYLNIYLSWSFFSIYLFSIYLSFYLFFSIHISTEGGGRRSLDIWLYISNYIRYLNINPTIDLFFLSIFFLSLTL